jgi:hypothetical protein
MNILYQGIGYLIPTKADGCFNIRKALWKELKKDDHHIIFFGHMKGGNRAQDSLKSLQNTNRKQFFEEDSSDELYTNLTVLKDNILPEDIQLVIFETNLQNNAAVQNDKEILRILNYYTNKNISCMLWDMDNKLYENNKFLNVIENRKYDIDISKVHILTPYSTQRNSKFNQIEFYYGYDKDEDINVDVSEKNVDFMYIGKHYKRDEKMKYYFKNLDVIIYGKYESHNIEKQTQINMLIKYIGKEKFAGSIPPNEVVKRLSKSKACIQIVPSDYARLGLMTQRINECANAGTLLFMDKDIKDADKFTASDQVISTAKEAQQKLKEILADGSYNKRIEKQRAMLPTYKKQMSRIYDIIKQNKG